MQIVGIAGYAQSGKDTAAKHLVDNYGFFRIAFADGVRRALYALNPTINIHWDSPESVRKLISKRVHNYILLQELVDSVDWEEAKKVPEIRGLLQRIGTEVGREQFGKNHWVNIARRKMKGHDKIVFTDVRFPNEVKMIKSKGGIMLRICSDKSKPANEHSSEIPLADKLIDHEISNNGTIEQLWKEIEKYIYER